MQPGSTALRLLLATIRARWSRCRRSTDFQTAFAPDALPSHPSGGACDGVHRWIRARSPRDERGAVTAELAVALPLLLAVTIGLSWLLAVGVAQVRVVDAARETARAVARGDSEASAVGIGQRVAPPGSSVAVSRSGEEVVVAVTGEVAGPGGLFDFLPGVTVGAEAVAATEPSS